jgi:hypothetical protein
MQYEIVFCVQIFLKDSAAVFKIIREDSGEVGFLVHSKLNVKKFETANCRPWD